MLGGILCNPIFGCNRQTNGRTKRQSRVIHTNINFFNKCNSTYPSNMKYTLCYMMLLFAVHTDNIAGILRGIKDVDNIPYYLEPKRCKD